MSHESHKMKIANMGTGGLGGYFGGVLARAGQEVTFIARGEHLDAIGFTGRGGAADIYVHPNGRFVYASIRSSLTHNSIASFAIDEKSGKLMPLAHTSTEGSIPRNFAIDPAGSFMVVANQLSDNLVIFRLEADGEKISLTGHSAAVPNPTCIKFFITDRATKFATQ